MATDRTSGRHNAFREQVKTNNNKGRSEEPLDVHAETWPGQQPSLQASLDTGILDASVEQGHHGSHSLYPTLVSASNQPRVPSPLERSSTLGDLPDGMHALSVNTIPWDVQQALPAKRRADDANDPAEQRSGSPLKLPRTATAATGGSARLSQLSSLSPAQRVSLSQRSQPNLRTIKNPANSSLTHQRQWSLPAQHPLDPSQPPQTSFLRSSQTLPVVRSDSIQVHAPSSSHVSSQGRKNSIDSDSHVEQPHTSLVLQPDSRPMPAGQLAAEIKAIYSGLVMIEAKCIEVVHTENGRLREIRLGRQPHPRPVADNESHWPALISIHRALLQEHHDFFLASQHPASSPALKNLAIKYSMPARMWKHGIHSFLELLRHSLPESMEFMQAFIILSYQMIALLYETVDSFKDTWIECLGDLARYRMAIEDEDPRDRDIYTIVSKSWYSKASRRNVHIGRLYHHQAILARTLPLKQLSLYARSLGAVQPFNSARESIMTLFEPVLSRIHLPGSSSTSIDSRFIRLVAMRFANRLITEYYPQTLAPFLSQFDASISQAGQAWRVIGEYMAITQITSLLQFGDPKSALRDLFLRKESSSSASASRRNVFGVGDREYRERLSLARDFKSRMTNEWYLLISMLKIVLKRGSDENTLPYVHIITSLVWALSCVQYGSEYLDDRFPFTEFSGFLNALLEEKEVDEVKSESGADTVLREDRSMHGQVWAQKLFKPEHFPDPDSEEEEYGETASTTRARKNRILSLAHKIAAKGASEDATVNKRWLFRFDNASKQFSVVERFSKSPVANLPSSPTDNRKNTGLVEPAIAGDDHPMMGTEIA